MRQMKSTPRNPKGRFTRIEIGGYPNAKIDRDMEETILDMDLKELILGKQWLSGIILQMNRLIGIKQRRKHLEAKIKRNSTTKPN